MNKTILQKKSAVIPLALFCCLLWGSAFPCIKIGYRLFAIPSNAPASQILFAGCRFTLSGIFTILIGSLLNESFLHPVQGSWKRIFALSLTQTVLQYLLFYIGLAHTSGVKASIMEGTSVFFAVLISCLIFRQEKLTPKKLAACLIGFAGVALVNLSREQMSFSFSLLGEGFLLLSNIAYATSSALICKFSKQDDPVMLSGYQFLLGGGLMILLGRAAGGRLPVVTPAGLLMLGYLAVLSAAAYSLWGILLKYNPVSKIAVYSFTNPIFGVLLSALLLQEHSQAFGIIGLAALALVCTGIFLTNREAL